jgi:phosphoglycerol transferase MdoB-like AlkP superfamily enzyme
MRARLRIFLSLVIFWLLFMMTARIFFLTYNWDLTAGLTAKEIFLSLLHGLRMDASMSGYFLAASGLLLTISSFFNKRWISEVLIILHILLIVLSTLIVTVDLELYRHWGFRLNTTPLMYIGAEAMGSVSPAVYLKLSFIFIALVLSFLHLFRKRISPQIKYIEDAGVPGKTAAALLFISALMFIPIRGSFTVAPMNTGFVYYHNTKPFANHSAVNVIWNFLYSVRKGSSSDYPENFYDKDKTEQLFSELYESTGTTTTVLKNNRPNIILIIMESFTADVVEPLGGLKGVTPYLNKLCGEGILFSNIYSSGDRTDKGLISILSGYPAQPQGSIIKLPSKTEKLPQLNRFIKKLGYKTSFLYGGDIDFANFRSYLNSSGFDQITTLDDFERDLYTSKWGVHDQFMFEKATHELDTTTETFFKVILTLSSHEPFDVPLNPPFREGNDEESLFVNSCHYTDQSLGRFIEYCRTKEWWNNTLVIITADHGHRYPGNKELIQKERFHIPLLMIGGSVSKDTVVHTIGNQTDIANTLLGQIDQVTKDFVFSKDLLNKTTKPFSAYFFTDGYGFVFPDKYVVYDNAGKRFLKDDGASEQDIEISKAYQQKLFSNYNKLDK